MRHITILCLATASGALLMGPHEVRAQQAAPADHLADIRTCSVIEADTERLACYDRSVRSLDAAEKRGDIVVVDRAEVRETRRQLFGFNLPPVAMFDRTSNAADAVDEVSTTLASARQVGFKWVLTLEDGSVWRQTDSSAFRFPNQPGTAVEIRQGALNSFLMRVGTSRSVRVERVR